MCRIAGLFNPRSQSLSGDIIAMRDCMRHGGPDAEGIYVDEQLPFALGHRRLSFLDLSPAGNQPMADLDGALQLVFNGEIYNFKELRHELQTLGHVFRTGSDTEVILKAYMQWNTACFARFNGMFALALFDRRSSSLVLARDHAGIKPLYYSLTKDTLYFASEVKAFTAIDPYWQGNKDWKIHFLTFGHLPAPITTLQGVVPLEKGTAMVVHLPSLRFRIERFSKFSFSSAINTLPEAVAAVREKLERAVERHLISDAPIGLFLSGGLDSSLLTLLAHKTLGNNLHTISINFEDVQFSEEKFQKVIIEKTGAKHSSITVTESEFATCLPDILNAMDQPSIDGVNSYFISKYARKYDLKAVLSGLGADELFGGYDSFYNIGKVNLVSKLPSVVFALTEGFTDHRKKRLSFLQRKDILRNYLLNRGLFTPSQTASILNCSEQEVHTALGAVQVPPARSFNDKRNLVSWFEQNLYMQNQLLKDTDYMSMWHGLEVRVPFLDKELMEVAHAIAPEVKYDPVMKKHLLVKAFQDIIPREIYERKKQGFIFPFSRWIQNVHSSNNRDKTLLQKYKLFKAGTIPWAQYWAYLLTCHRNAIRYDRRSVDRVLFLNLKAFSKTGGIEKFNRAFLKALGDIESKGVLVSDGWSCYDDQANDQYFDSRFYKGFRGNRIKFVAAAVKAAGQYNTIVLGHINLATIGWLIKKLMPSKKVILIAHGIEVWHELGYVQNQLVQLADRVLAVSRFTSETMQRLHVISADKISIFHNTLDPYFSFPKYFSKPDYLLQRYGLTLEQPVIFTLTRLAFSEKYKGYDKVMEVMPGLVKCFPNIKYILAGKADDQEFARLQVLIRENKLDNHVILTGFVAEQEVADHFLLADTFVMPSSKEGFGIVFIEAMACGLPVIGGNKDGSVDALKQGELGTLINPESKSEIAAAIEQALRLDNSTRRKNINKPQLQHLVIEAFGFNTFTNKLRAVLLKS